MPLYHRLRVLLHINIQLLYYLSIVLFKKIFYLFEIFTVVKGGALRQTQTASIDGIGHAIPVN